MVRSPIKKKLYLNYNYNNIVRDEVKRFGRNREAVGFGTAEDANNLKNACPERQLLQSHNPDIQHYTTYYVHGRVCLIVRTPTV